MLKVAFEKDGMELTLRVIGHAGQADIGHDIVCSACSILAYTVAQLVKAAGDVEDLKYTPEIKLDSGDAVISCIPKEDTYCTILGIYMFAEVGYKLLAHNFPQFVELKPFGTV